MADSSRQSAAARRGPCWQSLRFGGATLTDKWPNHPSVDSPGSPMPARKCCRLGSVYMPAFTAVRTTKVWMPDIVLRRPRQRKVEWVPAFGGYPSV